MEKRMRQGVCLTGAIAVYFLVHEGAHAIMAAYYGVLKRVNIMLMGIQVDVYAEQMTPLQMGVFCLAGAVATLVTAWLLVLLRERICALKSKYVRALAWYVTLVLLVLDPLYLTVLHFLVGGGDMNGIALIMPKACAIGIFALLLVAGIAAMVRWVYPAYKRSFAEA